MSFLGKRSFVIKTVRDKDLSNVIDASPENATDPWEGVQLAAAYSEIAKDFVTHAAFTIGGVYAACKIIGKICK